MPPRRSAPSSRSASRSSTRIRLLRRLRGRLRRLELCLRGLHARPLREVDLLLAVLSAVAASGLRAVAHVVRNDHGYQRVAVVPGEVGRAIERGVDAARAGARALGAQREVDVVRADVRALDVSAGVAAALGVVRLVARDRDQLDRGIRVAGVEHRDVDVHRHELVVGWPELRGIRRGEQQRRRGVGHRHQRGVRGAGLNSGVGVGEGDRERDLGGADREDTDRCQAGGVVERHARCAPQEAEVRSDAGAHAGEVDRRAVLTGAGNGLVRPGVGHRGRLRRRGARERETGRERDCVESHRSSPSDTPRTSSRRERGSV